MKKKGYSMQYKDTRIQIVKMATGNLFAKKENNETSQNFTINFTSTFYIIFLATSNSHALEKQDCPLPILRICSTILASSILIFSPE